MTLTKFDVTGTERNTRKLTGVLKSRFGAVALSWLILFGGLSSALAQNLSNAPKDTRYLALGDSLAFGFNPFVNPPDDSKYIGYPQILSPVLNLKVANASCPGETSTSFIQASGALPGYTCGPNPTATVYGNSGPVILPVAHYVPYNGAATELQYAVNYLKSNPNTKLVTINIGGNDLAPLLTCTSGCDVLAATLLGNLANNLVMIYSAIRGTGYQGPLIAVNYYAFNFKDPLQVGPSGAFTALNATIAQVTTLPQFGGKVADAFDAFRLASNFFGGDPCKAGLLLRIPNSNTCDTHPTLIGQLLIAGAVAVEFQKHDH